MPYHFFDRCCSIQLVVHLGYIYTTNPQRSRSREQFDVVERHAAVVVRAGGQLEPELDVIVDGNTATESAGASHTHHSLKHLPSADVLGVDLAEVHLAPAVLSAGDDALERDGAGHEPALERQAELGGGHGLREPQGDGRGRRGGRPCALVVEEEGAARGAGSGGRDAVER